MDIVQTAYEIAEEYQDQGLTLTLRQLYYQFVSRGLVQSGQKSYSRIGQALTKARYRGTFPVEWIDDRGRSVNAGKFTRYDVNQDWVCYQAANSLRDMPFWFCDVDKWYGQRTFVAVVAEKDAVSNILEPVCKDLGVAHVAFKGYPSVSVMRDFLQVVALATSGKAFFHETDRKKERDERFTLKGTQRDVVVLYLGDHDPDGLEIPQAAERGLRKLMNVMGLRVNLQFKRIALSMEQIRKYNPPSFEAKKGARLRKYIEKTGLEEAWELDALEPRVMQQLIRDEVSMYFDKTMAQHAQWLANDARAKMRQRMATMEWIKQALDGQIQEPERVDEEGREIPMASEVLEALAEVTDRHADEDNDDDFEDDEEE